MIVTDEVRRLIHHLIQVFVTGIIGAFNVVVDYWSLTRQTIPRLRVAALHPVAKEIVVAIHRRSSANTLATHIVHRAGVTIIARCLIEGIQTPALAIAKIVRTGVEVVANSRFWFVDHLIEFIVATVYGAIYSVISYRNIRSNALFRDAVAALDAVTKKRIVALARSRLAGTLIAFMQCAIIAIVAISVQGAFGNHGLATANFLRHQISFVATPASATLQRN